MRKDLVELCAGPMTLKDVEREIIHYMERYAPNEMVIKIKKREDLGKYFTTIYIKRSDIEDGKRKS